MRVEEHKLITVCFVHALAIPFSLYLFPQESMSLITDGFLHHNGVIAIYHMPFKSIIYHTLKTFKDILIAQDVCGEK